MLVKLYRESQEQIVEKRYSPAKYVSSKKTVVFGDPDPKYISTSFVERNNLTMRMGMRRFTRLTNGFSKKAENLAHALSLHFMYYDFARIHQSSAGYSGDGGGDHRPSLDDGGALPRLT